MRLFFGVNKFYVIFVSLIALAIAGVSAWRILAILEFEPSNWLSWLVAILVLTVSLLLFWAVVLFTIWPAVAKSATPGAGQRLLLGLLGMMVCGLAGGLLISPAGLARIRLELYAQNVWSPNIFTLSWLSDGLWQAPFTLPLGQATPINVEISVSPGDPVASGTDPRTVWLINAFWPDGSPIPLDQFQAEAGWDRREINWQSYRGQKVWIATEHAGATDAPPSILRWQGVAPGPLTLVFAKHNQGGSVTVRWNGLEQTLDLHAPQIEFAGVTLPLADDPIVWRTQLPLSALQAEEMGITIEPDPGGQYPAVLQKLRVGGLPGQTVELSGSALLQALQVKDGQANLTAEGVQFTPEDPREPPQIFLTSPLVAELTWLTQIMPWLENGLLVLYAAAAGLVVGMGLARLLPVKVVTVLNQVTLSVLIILVIGEVGPRFFLPLTGKYYVWQPNQQMIFNPAPGIMPGIESESRFIINSQGIRGDEFAAKDGYRILAIGGSTTICLYLDQQETWPQLVQTQLNQRQSNLSVWTGNVGKSARTTREHVLQMQYLLPQYPHIDAVIMLIGFNDFNSSFRWGDNNPYVETSLGARQTVMKRAFDVLVEQDPFAPYYQQTVIGRMVRKFQESRIQVATAGTEDNIDVDDAAGLNYRERRQKRQNAPKRDELPDLSTGLAEYSSNINKIIDLAQAYKTRLIFMTQPSIYRPDLTEAEDSLLWLGAGPGRNYFYSVKAMAEGLSQYNQTLLEICRQRQVECIDLAAVLPKNTTVFYDDAHFNEHGAQLVASTVTDYLLSQPPFKPQ